MAGRRKKTSRVLTTLVAGVVMLGTLAGGTASAGVGDGGVEVIDVHLVDDTRDIAALVSAVQSLAQNCTRDEGLCTTVLESATDAVDAASACLNALESEVGVSPAVTSAMGAMGLDCGGIARLMAGYAQFALQQVNACTTEQTALCQTVFDAARLGIDRAAGCLAAVLPPGNDGLLAIGGTDPGCAAAVGMLYREAEGLIALLSGCLYGEDTTRCAEIGRIADYALDGLTGCVGDLWVAPDDVRPTPLDHDGPIDCYAVLDRVNVVVNQWIGQMPTLPTTITPTNEEECSITVMPPVPHVGPEAEPIEPYDADVFVPSCMEPEWLAASTDVASPPLPAGLEGPECENATATEKYEITRTTGDAKKLYGHDIVVNVNVKSVPMELSSSVEETYKAKITVGAEGEIGKWIVKINTRWSIEAEVSRTIKRTKTFSPPVPPKTEMHLARVLHAKVVEGKVYRKTTDCRVYVGNRRIKAPYQDKWFIWQEPYNGGPPE